MLVEAALADPLGGRLQVLDGRRIDRESSTVSSKLMVKETNSAISTLIPSASVPPPSEVSAATTTPVITLISGSEPSSLTRNGTTGRSILTGTSSAC